jgi:phosphatidate phosphatase APP1
MEGGWQRWAARVAHRVERRVDHVRTSVRGARAARQVQPYSGYGTAEEVFLSGRVLANRRAGPVRPDDTWWRNLATSLRHLESDEVPAARVRIEFRGTATDVFTDDEGYFRAWLRSAHTATPGSPATAWQDAHVRVVEPVQPEAAPVEDVGRVLIPGTRAAFGVISDIDDTVIRTEATRLLRMLKRTLLENARTRLPFAGVAAFYSALRRGTPDDAGNPIFYVSSSPWNLYPVLTDFLEHQAIPAGPLVLRDWGLSAAGALPTAHGAHKLGAIRQIFQTYPRLPFILIGDSGQEDPEIYRDLVHEYGSRVLAVYIRDVTPGGERRNVIAQLAEEVRSAGSELLLSEDTLASTMHAAARGWVDRAAIDHVMTEVSSAAARPG